MWLNTGESWVTNQTPDKSKLDFGYYKTTTSVKKEYQGLKREKTKNILRFLNKISDYYMINISKN